MHPFLHRQFGFMGSQATHQQADFVLFGVPMDFTVSFQSGTRFGPQAIRLVSDALEEYSYYQQGSLKDVKYYDAGDLDLPLGNTLLSLDRIEKVADNIFISNKLPVAMGGEHLISFPLVKAAKKHFEDLVVFHFDAHGDLREDYGGEIYNHATVMRHVGKLVGFENLYQFGIRSGSAEELAFAKSNVNFFFDEILEPLNRLANGWQGGPIYLSIDIDVVDPAFAPGTGTPEPGGCTSKEILQAMLLMVKLPVVALDIVEVSPQRDQSQRTAVLAAKLIREALIGLHLNKNTL
ncbi:MAG: agmatinase [Bacillota bacterium]